MLKILPVTFETVANRGIGDVQAIFVCCNSIFEDFNVTQKLKVRMGYNSNVFLISARRCLSRNTKIITIDPGGAKLWQSEFEIWHNRWSHLKKNVYSLTSLDQIASNLVFGGGGGGGASE